MSRYKRKPARTGAGPARNAISQQAPHPDDMMPRHGEGAAGGMAGGVKERFGWRRPKSGGGMAGGVTGRRRPKKVPNIDDIL